MCIFLANNKNGHIIIRCHDKTTKKNAKIKENEGKEQTLQINSTKYPLSSHNQMQNKKTNQNKSKTSNKNKHKNKTKSNRDSKAAKHGVLPNIISKSNNTRNVPYTKLSQIKNGKFKIKSKIQSYDAIVQSLARDHVLPVMPCSYRIVSNFIFVFHKVHVCCFVLPLVFVSPQPLSLSCFRPKTKTKRQKMEGTQ